MDINFSKEANSAIISISGRLDTITAPDFEAGLKQWLEKNERILIIDLGSVDYISSAGLRIILATAKIMKTRDGQLLLARLQPDVKRVFEISGFTTILPVYETIQSALKAAK
jgi:anti-anti-sigma factor